jgi:hypothetical protein
MRLLCLALPVLLLAVAPRAVVAQECREYATTAEIGGRMQRVIGTACRQPDGSWQVISSRPARQDHDRARSAVRSGEALPLDQVLARLRPRYGGKLLDVKLADGPGGSLQYRLKMLSPDNRVRDLTVDARTGQVLNVREGR